MRSLKERIWDLEEIQGEGLDVIGRALYTLEREIGMSYEKMHTIMLIDCRVPIKRKITTKLKKLRQNQKILEAMEAEKDA